MEDIKLGGYFYCPNCQGYHSSAMTCEQVQAARKHHKEIFDNLFRETTEEEKAMQTQTLFTLTAEEVEELKQLLEKRISDLNRTKIFYSNLQLWFDNYNKVDNLLNRIKQWQDENNRTTKEDN